MRVGVPVVVAGGGPVGSTLALALAGAGVEVVLADPAPGLSDDRPIALAVSSVRILQTLGVWPCIGDQACPIVTIHVSEKGRFGMVRLRAGEQGVDALGQVVSASAIQAALDAALERQPAVRRLRSARILGAATDADWIHARGDGAGDVFPPARLLAAAEGGSSMLLERLGVTRHETAYHQAAVVCTVSPGRPHEGTAYERFTRTGPLALLPLASGRCALVWTLPEEEAGRVMALGEVEFLAALQREFGHRLGVLREVGERARFPLALVRSEPITLPRVALAGNAANRLHPVAGQGLNLGLRDAATLAELIAAAVRRGVDPGAPEVLDAYRRNRLHDQRSVVRFTDTLARGFTHAPGPVGPARSLAMLALDLLPPLGHSLARRAMGLAGRQPRLVRGVMP